MKKSLKQKFDTEIVGMLEKELGRKNKLSLPRLIKVSVNVGIGSLATQGIKDFAFVEENVAAITGQKPALRKARIAISNFKLKAGMPVGYVVTLRGKRMYDFVERLVNVALPRVRDFRGISPRGFDGKGNYSLGLKDITIFPEINQENLVKLHGIEININTTANNDAEALALLKAMGFPFRDNKQAK